MDGVRVLLVIAAILEVNFQGRDGFRVATETVEGECFVPILVIGGRLFDQQGIGHGERGGPVVVQFSEEPADGVLGFCILDLVLCVLENRC